MLAQQQIEEGDRSAADLFMDPAHAIRRALTTLHRLSHRVHTNYDFNADPDRMTLEIGETLKGFVAPSNVADEQRRGKDTA